MVKNPQVELVAKQEPEDVSVENLLALAAIGLAAVQTLETLLPSAARDVEDASRDMAQRLTTLAYSAAAQEKLIKQMLAILLATGVDEPTRKMLEAEAARLSGHIMHSVKDLVIDMQFQDRNTQMMESATHMLQRYGAMLNELRDKIQSVRSTSKVDGVGDIIDGILSGIRFGEIRQQFVASLHKAEVLYHTGDAGSTKPPGEDDVELF